MNDVRNDLDAPMTATEVFYKLRRNDQVQYMYYQVFHNQRSRSAPITNAEYNHRDTSQRNIV